MYRRKDGRVLIEIKLTSVSQLFNSFDPAPFYEKELDSDAEEYIVDTVQDFPAKTKFMILIYLPPALVVSEEVKKIIPGIHNHFQDPDACYGTESQAENPVGRFSLLVGLSFLAVALIASQSRCRPEYVYYRPASFVFTFDHRLGGDVAADHHIPI